MLHNYFKENRRSTIHSVLKMHRPAPLTGHLFYDVGRDPVKDKQKNFFKWIGKRKKRKKKTLEVLVPKRVTSLSLTLTNKTVFSDNVYIIVICYIRLNK